MRFLFILTALLFSFSIDAQVNFHSYSLEEALQQASAEGKLVFLQFEAAECQQCNDVANKGFEQKELAAKMEQTFICLKIGSEHPDRNKIAARYNINAAKGFGSLFLDHNGNLLYTYPRTTSFYKAYLEQIDIALGKAGETMMISELEREYKTGNRSFGFLESLLLKRKALNLATDALLDEYVDALPVDSLQSKQTICFLARMAPLIASKADLVMRQNSSLFNQAWYTMPLSERVNINNRIIYKSMQKAIAGRDELYASRTASFAQGTNAANYAAGAKAYDMNMLRFYDAINDTVNYFRKAIAYYERYLLAVSPDSIKRLDSVNLRRMMQTAPKDTVRAGNSVRLTSKVSYAPMVQWFSTELNNGAYSLYQRTGNTYLLGIALEWSKKALMFYESPESYDTYAKLLYKLGKKEEAIDAIHRAVSLQQKRGMPTKRYEEVQMRMEKNEKPE